MYGSGALLVVSVCVALEAGRGRRPPLGRFRLRSAILGTRSVMESLAAPSVEAMTPSTPFVPPNAPFTPHSAVQPTPTLTTRSLYPSPPWTAIPRLVPHAVREIARTAPPHCVLSLFLSVSVIESVYVIRLLAHGHAIAFVARRKQTGTRCTACVLLHSGIVFRFAKESRG